MLKWIQLHQSHIVKISWPLWLEKKLLIHFLLFISHTVHTDSNYINRVMLRVSSSFERFSRGQLCRWFEMGNMETTLINNCFKVPQLLVTLCLTLSHCLYLISYWLQQLGVNIQLVKSPDFWAATALFFIKTLILIKRPMIGCCQHFEHANM